MSGIFRSVKHNLPTQLLIKDIDNYIPPTTHPQYDEATLMAKADINSAFGSFQSFKFDKLNSIKLMETDKNVMSSKDPDETNVGHNSINQITNKQDILDESHLESIMDTEEDMTREVSMDLETSRTMDVLARNNGNQNASRFEENAVSYRTSSMSSSLPALKHEFHSTALQQERSSHPASEISTHFSSAIESSSEPDQSGFLPWWLSYVAWICIVVSSLVFTFFTILYTFEYGIGKSIDWAISVVISFSIGTFIKEPAKVVLVATILAICFKKQQDLELHNIEAITDVSVRG